MSASATAAANQDSDELEALFDSIAAAARPAVQRANGGASMHETDSCPADKLIEQVGQLTRRLHETLRGLGYDRSIESAARAIPDARERLSFVAAKSEQAAERCLNAIDSAKPIQDKVEKEAAALSQRWAQVFEGKVTPDEFRALALQTRAYMDELPLHTRATRDHLNEIMMAQDFQDLTGQVLKKVGGMVQQVEQELLKLLIANVSARKREAAQSAGLLEGPAVPGVGGTEVVTSQAQVDELLESLGF
jgi:chemotaxis protein CheZ